MNRRDAVKSVAIIMGGTLSASTLSVMLNGCKSTPKKGDEVSFTTDEKDIIARIADVIIPRTDTPGALDAGAPDFIILMMGDCYPQKDQDEFHEGLSVFSGKWCKEKYGKSFLELDSEHQETAVAALDELVLSKKNEDKSLSFYRRLKELTLLGFFTSEPGATKTLRYMQVPGMYDGCFPYHEGDKAWAT